MSRYAVGIAIDRADRIVVVQKRASSPWYPGLWMFPGGKVEAGESARDGVTREFLEETGIRVPEARWEHVIGLDGDHPLSFFFVRLDDYVVAENRVGFDPGNIVLRKMTDEDVGLIHTKDHRLYDPKICCPKMAWAIHLALDTNLIKPIYMERKD